MRIYVTTEEPYHENSMIVGVHLIEEEAIKFVESRPRHALANDRDGVECWLLTCWDEETQKEISNRAFQQDYRSQKSICEPCKVPICNRDWRWKERWEEVEI